MSGLAVCSAVQQRIVHVSIERALLTVRRAALSQLVLFTLSEQCFVVQSIRLITVHVQSSHQPLASYLDFLDAVSYHAG